LPINIIVSLPAFTGFIFGFIGAIEGLVDIIAKLFKNKKISTVNNKEKMRWGLIGILINITAITIIIMRVVLYGPVEIT
jgi:hypothetical protein